MTGEREDMEVRRIAPEAEKPFRKALGHAARGELEEMEKLLAGISEEQVAEGLSLCVLVAGYTAIDVCGREWPNDANLHRIAKGTTTGSNAQKVGLQERDVYDFVTRASLRFEPVNSVFPEPERMVMLPFLITAHLLVSFGPREKEWWEFLDSIEESFEAADAVDLDLLPALMLRSRRAASTGTPDAARR